VTKAGVGVDSLQISLLAIVNRLLQDYGNVNTSDIPPDQMSSIAEKSGLKVKVCLRQAQLKREKGKLEPALYEAVILYSINRRAE